CGSMLRFRFLTSSSKEVEVVRALEIGASRRAVRSARPPRAPRHSALRRASGVGGRFGRGNPGSRRPTRVDTQPSPEAAGGCGCHAHPRRGHIPLLFGGLRRPAQADFVSVGGLLQEGWQVLLLLLIFLA